MIKQLTIKNYKSIKEINISAKRVNVFIGEYNSGKSNILEALSWFSTNALNADVFPEMFRFKTATDLFYDFDASNPIEVKTDDLSLIIRYAKNNNGALMNHFEGLIYPSGLIYPDESTVDPNIINDWYNNLKGKFPNYYAFRLEFNGTLNFIDGHLESKFRTYIFKRLKAFQNNFRPFLNPPFGENIPSLLVSNKNYKELIGSIFKEKGFRLMLKPTEGDINMAKDVNDELYAYPYASISETLQRIVFYLLAIESNKNAIIVTDEPESNTFPMYTKQLAELIAFDNSNQYFIATHDPYLLDSLISKTPIDQLSVFITKMEDYQTSAQSVSNEKLSELLDRGVDFYFNLDKLAS